MSPHWTCGKFTDRQIGLIMHARHHTGSLDDPADAALFSNCLVCTSQCNEFSGGLTKCDKDDMPAPPPSKRARQERSADSDRARSHREWWPLAPTDADETLQLRYCCATCCSGIVQTIQISVMNPQNTAKAGRLVKIVSCIPVKNSKLQPWLRCNNVVGF